MMTHQAGVRTIVVGGRPEPGPMQATSGSRGALAYSGDYIDADIYLLNTTTNGADMSSVLPVLNKRTHERDSGMYLTVAGFNLRDQVRSGAGGPPLQFTYEAADCRLYWTLDNALNMTQLWSDAAGAMWPDLGLNASCVPGSTGYASHGNTTAAKAAPENKATGVAPLPAEEWNYDTSPSDSEAGYYTLEDMPLDQSREQLSQIHSCKAAQVNTIRQGTQNVCQLIQVVCSNDKKGTPAYFYVQPCTNNSCGSGFYCDTTLASSPESKQARQLGKKGKGATKVQAQGYCVPTTGSLATKTKGLGCPL